MTNETNVDRLPSATGTISRLAYREALARGAPVESLLAKAGLSAAQMADSRIRLSVRAQIEFLNLVSNAVDDPFLGFHLAQQPDLREMGLFYYVLASSQMLIDALQRVERYTCLLNDGIAQVFIEGQNPGIGLRHVGVSRQSDIHQVEFWLTLLLRACRHLTARSFTPLALRFMHQRQSCPAEYTAFFGDSVEFGAAVDEISFPESAKSLSIVSADPYLNNLLLAYCEEALANRQQTRGTFRLRVENALVPLLPHGKMRVGDIARSLGVSQRTLARRLEAEGTSFAHVLDDLRSALARRYLADEYISISQIAWMLGYREVSSLSHAFKRWTGITPREQRQQLPLSAPNRSLTP